MGGYPIQAILIPLVAVVFVIVMVVRQKRALANQDVQYAQYKAGALAQRLGLRLVQGDPEYNLFIRNASEAGSARVKDEQAKHIEVVLEGEAEGLPVQLRYLYRVEQKTGFTEVERKTWDRCTYTARARQAFPPFEVASRKAPMGQIVREQNLPESPTGNPAVDRQYLVTTQEPAMAQLLGQVLGAFATFENAGVHLIGDGQTVTFVMHEAKPPLLANALYFAEELQARVVDIAQKVGG